MLFAAHALLALCAVAQGSDAAKWVASLEQLESSEIDAAIAKRVETAKGTPLAFGEHVVFLAMAKGKAAPRIVGDFNDGGYASSALVGDGSMKRIADSGWYARIAKLPRDARFEYRIRYGTQSQHDPRNPKRVQNEGEARSVCAGPTAPQLAKRETKRESRGLREFEIESRARKNKRKVTLWLPPGYSREGPRIPTVYVKDGTRMRGEGRILGVFRSMMAKKQIPSVVVVMTDAVNRGLEYGTADSYRRFVVDELVPEVERRFRTGGSSARRTLIGWSRGGLAVLDLLLRDPETFGACAMIAPALSPLPILAQIENQDEISGRFVVLRPRYDNPKLVKDGRGLEKVLRTDADLRVIDVATDHSVVSWRPYWPRVLRALLGD